MSTINLNASALGSPLATLLSSNDAIEPGSAPSYELCKIIYLYHPLGAKLAAKPIELAQSQQREISIPNSPETRVREAFQDEWRALHADMYIANAATLARVYGISTLAVLTKDEPVNGAIDFWTLYKKEIAFNIYDPMNTAGSLVLNQNPMAIDFQHVTDIRVAGQPFHRSRTCTIMNEQPVYIAYSASAFGFVGRSVYQRILFPMKSFVQTMVADDMVARKVGVIIAKMKQAASTADNAIASLFRMKRALLKEAQNNNVLGIGTDEEIESLNLQNLEGPLKTSRQNILENIATGAPMPAKLVTQESLASTFSEGSEDAKEIARYTDGVREWMGDLYDFMTKVVKYRAWNPDFYKTIQNDHSEYRNVDYQTAFMQWNNSAVFTWPNLIKEPDSEKVKVEDVKLRAVVALLEAILPVLDPVNKVLAIQWAVDQFNDLKFLFKSSPLILDAVELENYTPPEQQLNDEPKPEGFRNDSQQQAIGAFKAAVLSLVTK